MNTPTITDIIRRRRSVYPKMYADRPLSEDIIREVLENANWAPTHRLTEPWRFRVFRGDALRRLGEFLSGQYRAGTSEAEFSDLKYKKMLDAPQRSGAVIAVCMQRDPENRVREWEEIAAVACAVQNMWLTCTSYGIGSYWSTPGYILQADEWLGLQPGERCLGLFYMGWYDEVELPAKRGSIEDKTLWINE
ncbi:MAG: nitroreductase [Saprospiraceae bacterium]|nr:nitroreductase [Saprospiraceae bacterium]HRD81861.1 nitroreductase [Saprospiraceae bacterium]